MSICWKTGLRRAMAVLLSVLCVWSGCFASALAEASVSAAPLTARSGAANGMVRVYLSSLGSPTTLTLTIQGNYSLGGAFLSNGERVTVSMNPSTGNITLTYGGVTVNAGKTARLCRHSASGSNGILIAQARESANPYPGDLSFEAVAVSGGYKLYTIAHIYIENYLYGVLPYEMGNSTHLEALKAQAVAARTYTVRMMESRASGRYDVQDTTSDQVYRGTPAGNANCVAAVDATKGIVLMSGSGYITTYYSASNGGQTELNRTGTSAAYMRVKDDPFDYENPSSTVKKKTIYADLQSGKNPAALTSLLKARAVAKLVQMGYAANEANTALLTLQGVKAHTPKYAAPSRLYTKMDFTLTVRTLNAASQNVTTSLTVTCDIFGELESMLSMGIQSLDNELWTVEETGGNFSLQARRYGHGMGMSQRGAMQMAKLGYTYDQILGFYYEGCQRVRHSFTNTILSASSTLVETTVETPAELGEDAAGACGGTVRAGGAVALRTARSYDAASAGIVPGSAMVRVLSADAQWCLVRFGELCGYLPREMLTLQGTPPQESAEVSRVMGFVTVTANDFVNLRKSGDMQAQILGTAPTGAVLNVFEKKGSWYRVQYNLLSAWVNAGYVSGVSGGASQAGASTAHVTLAQPLRAEASEDGEVLVVVTEQASLTVLADDGSWARVNYDGLTGYVLSGLLTYGNAAPPQSTTPSVPADAGTAAQPTAVKAVVATQKDPLNMRAKPQAGSRILTTIPRMATVWVTQRGGEWSGVAYEGRNGYVMTVYLRFESESAPTIEPPAQTEDKPVEPQPSGTQTPASENSEETPGGEEKPDEEDGTAISPDDPADGEHSAQTDGTAAESKPEDDADRPSSENGSEATVEKSPAVRTAYVQTASGGLNLRNLPGGTRVLTVIPRNAALTVLAYGADWCAVRYAGWEGYVMTGFLRFENEDMPAGPTVETPAETDKPAEEAGMPAFAQGLQARVNTASGPLNLRTSPTEQGRVLAQMPRGSELTVLSQEGAWSFVCYRSQYGYAKTSYLAMGTAEQAKEPTADTSAAAQPGPEPSTDLQPSESGMPQEPSRADAEPEAQDEPDAPEQPAPEQAVEQPVQAGETQGGIRLDVTLEAPDEPLFATALTDLTLWPECATGGSAAGRVPAGETAEVILRGDTWCRIDYHGRQGYCHTNELDGV